MKTTQIREKIVLTALFLLMILAKNNVIAEEQKEFTKSELEAGDQIAYCMEKTDWRSTAVSSPYFGKAFITPNHGENRLVLVEAEKFDVIAKCIDHYNYEGVQIFDLETSYSDEIDIKPNMKYFLERALHYYTVPIRGIFFTVNPEDVLVDRGSTRALVADSITEYRRVPDFPGICDSIEDPTSKKWCTGELTYKDNDPRVTGCKNNFNDPCGTQYDKTTEGYIKRE